MNTNVKERNIWLDLLKSVAIVAVILYHLGIFEYGYLGVDLFLVINGFLIIKSIDKSLNKNQFSYFKFLYNKLIRLWPLVILAGFVSLIIGYFNMLPDDLENLSQSVVASNFFGNNILSCITTGNYWDVVNSHKPLMHTWYLGIIVQCYVLLPLLLMGGYKISKKYGIKAIVLAFSIISLILYLIPGIPTAEKFYFLQYRLFEFGVGGIIAIFLKENNDSKFRKYSWISLVFIIVLLCPCFTFIKNELRLLLIVLFSTIGLLYIPFDKCNKYKICRLISKIGKASFSIYIWHQVIIAFYKYIYKVNMSLIDYIICSLIIIVVSVVSYLFVEKFIEKNNKVKRISAIVISIVLCLVTTVFSLYLYVSAGIVRDIPELDVYVSNRYRGVHAEYNDRVRKMDKDFSEEDNTKVLAIGNSFARDFVNVLLESDMKDELDITYIYELNDQEKYIRRIEQADYIFIVSPERNLPEILTKNVRDDTKIFGIGTKNFGESNGNVYNRRNHPDYFNQTAFVAENIQAEYEMEKKSWGDMYVDFIEPVKDSEGRVKIFTPDKKFISQDCRHLTKAGAVYYADILDLDSIFNDITINN